MIDLYATVDRKSTRLNSSHSQISYAVFCLKKKKRLLRSRRAHRENFLRNRSFKYLSDTIAEFRRSHASFNEPHGMIHVHKDSPYTTFVSLNICLAAVSTMRNVEGENLILEMNNTPSSFPIMLLALPVLPFSENDLLPGLARDHVDLRSHSWIQHCLGEDLNVSSKTSTKPLGDLSVEILDAS